MRNKTTNLFFLITESWDIMQDFLLKLKLMIQAIPNISGESVDMKTSEYVTYSIIGAKLMTLKFYIRRDFKKNLDRKNELWDVWSHLTRRKKDEVELDDVPIQLLNQSHINYVYRV